MATSDLLHAEYELEREMRKAREKRHYTRRMCSSESQHYHEGFCDGLERAWLVVGRMIDKHDDQ